MAKKFIGLVAGIVVIGGAATLFAQEGTSQQTGGGDIDAGEEDLPAKKRLAYETTIDDEEGIAVVLSGPAISSEKLKEAKKSEKGGKIPILTGLSSGWSSRTREHLRTGARRRGARCSAGVAATRPGNSSCRTVG